MTEWPKQSACTSFYGDPRAKDFEANLVIVPFPWLCVLAWDAGKRVKGAKVHKKCAESLARTFAGIWEAAGRSQDVINEWGLNLYGGGYAYRQKRGGGSLSMHAYGCALDFDPTRNQMGDYDPYLADCAIVTTAFEAEGWVWGGRWRHPDGMHFQAARVG